MTREPRIKGKSVHRMLDKNTITMTGICSNCGPVDIWRNTKGTYLCGPAREEQRRASGRNDPTRLWVTRKRLRELVEEAEVCAICDVYKDDARLGVDHVKGTDLVRGVLCTRCNLALGYFFHDPNLLREAAKYLEENPGRELDDPYGREVG